MDIAAPTGQLAGILEIGAIVKGPTRIAGNRFIHKGIKKLANVSGQRAVERRCSEIVVNNLTAIAFATHETGAIPGFTGNKLLIQQIKISVGTAIYDEIGRGSNTSGSRD